MLAVLDEGVFRQLIAGRELLAQVGVAHADVQCGARRGAGGGTHRHTPTDQGTEHREETAVRVLDRGAVIALLVHVGEAVEQVLARNAVVLEDQGAVVHAGQAALVAVIAEAHALDRGAVVLTDAGDEAVHAVRLLHARGVKLREDRGEAAVAGSVADVPLLRGRGGGVDDELLGLRVVGRGGLEVLDVGAVAALRHCEAAQRP